MKCWEYLTLVLDNDHVRAQYQLDTAGNDGWELVSVDRSLAFLKRPVAQGGYER